MLVGALVGIGTQSEFSTLGTVGGVGVGVLLVVAWSLRDGLLTGEPRFALARRIALAFFAAGLVLAVLLWVGGPAMGLTAIVTAGLVFVAWLLFVTVGTASVNREVESAIVTLGPGSGHRALIVYHSAHGGLMRAMQEAFANGLQAEGWQVDLSTASRLSPVEMSSYQLLVLGSPCYNRGLARPISAYLARLGDLQGMPVVNVVTGFNYTERAAQLLRTRVQHAHGRVLDEIELWTGRPNVARDGATQPEAIMRLAGARLARALTAAA